MQNICQYGAPARARATNVRTTAVNGHGIGRAHTSCDSVRKHAQPFRIAMLIAAICKCHAEATTRPTSVAQTQPCTCATATADAKRRLGHARAHARKQLPGARAVHPADAPLPPLQSRAFPCAVRSAGADDAAEPDVMFSSMSATVAGREHAGPAHRGRSAPPPTRQRKQRRRQRRVQRRSGRPGGLQVRLREGAFSLILNFSTSGLTLLAYFGTPGFPA